jgi:hypothetical protein
MDVKTAFLNGDLQEEVGGSVCTTATRVHPIWIGTQSTETPQNFVWFTSST